MFGFITFLPDGVLRCRAFFVKKFLCCEINLRTAYSEWWQKKRRRRRYRVRANERRRAILETLCERRRDTEVNLAFEFGVSRRTIVNDISELSLHYPISTVSGGIGGGGVYVEDWYRLDYKFLRTSSWNWQSGYYRI